MSYNPQKPIILQSDKTVLLEVDNSSYEEARDFLAKFAELEKSPEHIHTYRITPLSLWNAASSGVTTDEIIEGFAKFNKYDIPSNVVKDIQDYISRYGRVKLKRLDEKLILHSEDSILITELEHHKEIIPSISTRLDKNSLEIFPAQRGFVKQALINIGYPAEDLAGYLTGKHLYLELRKFTSRDKEFYLRDYQRWAVDVFYAGGSERGGSGVVVLPCGAGKTMVGMGIMEKLKCETLILCPNTIAVRQWISELSDKTTLSEEVLGEYTGDTKEIKPITIATYQILTYRKRKGEEFVHFHLFSSKDWGLIIYDEVHLLPAPVFQATAHIQARRRLGLTATLIREDGKEKEVFSLIGPKKCDVPWKVLEDQGWIATAECMEIRLPMSDDRRLSYAVGEDSQKYRIAAENPYKLDMIDILLEKHIEDNVLIIGQYLSQLKEIAKRVAAPVITGNTSNTVREKLYSNFRQGEIKRLIVSKVANFALDLPDANVAIQVSGTFGSRQEEAQRLGRILRPKQDGTLAYFYSLVTRDTKDQDFSAKRQMFLTEQGYKYLIADAELLGIKKI